MELHDIPTSKMAEIKATSRMILKMVTISGQQVNSCLMSH